MNQPPVFISCVSPEFRQTRSRVGNILTRLGYTPVIQEIFGTEPGDLRQILRDKINACEGLIQIVGQGYGAEPPTVDADCDRVSYTQFEFLYARAQKKKTWLLFAGDACTRDTPLERLDLPNDPAHPDPAGYQAERRALQLAYCDERKKDGHNYYDDIISDADLDLKVERLRDELAKLRWAEEAFRRELLAGQKEVLGHLTDINATVGSSHSFVLEMYGEIVKTNQKEKRKLPEDIRDAIDRGIKHTNEGHFEKARVEFQSALSLAENQKHALGIVDAKQYLAFILNYADNNLAGAKMLLQSCLDTLAIERDDGLRGKVLERLAQIHEREGNLEMTEAIQRQSLALSEHIDDKFGQGATLVSLAWTVSHSGRTDEVLQLNNKAYELLTQSLNELKGDDTINVELVNQLMANLFLQRAVICRRRGEPDQEEVALVDALMWQRKVRPNHELAKLLRKFAELKLFKRKLQDAAALLQEAAILYNERNMLAEFADCLRQLGRIHTSTRNFAKATEFLSEAARAARESGRNEQAAEVLLSLASLASEQEDFETAQSLYRDAMSASSDRKLRAECLRACLERGRGVMHLPLGV